MSSDTTPFGTSPFDPDPIGSSHAESGRHPLNVGQLVMGIAFLGLVGVAWAIEIDWIADADIRWLLPVPWVLAGLAGLLAVALGGRRRESEEYAASYQQPYYPTYDAPEAYDDTAVIPTDDTTTTKEQDR